MNINYILISLATLSSLNLAMELDQPKENPIIVHPTNKVSSLRKLAARSFCQAVHPNNTSCTLDQAKRLADKAAIVPQELKNYLAKRLAIENADVFEDMNSEKPDLLTKRNNCCSSQVTKDTKKVWFLEGSWQHTNRLICLDIATATETVLNLNKTLYKLATVDEIEGDDHFVPNYDGSEIAFACFHRGHHMAIFLVTYNTQTKQFNQIMQLPTRNVQLKSFNNNQVIMGCTQVNNAQDARTYLIDCAKKQMQTINESLLGVSPANNYFSTYNSLQKTMTLYNADGTRVQQFPHFRECRCAPGFNSDETIMATFVDNSVHIWDIKTQQLLHTIQYPFAINKVIFKNNETIIVLPTTRVEDNSAVYSAYKTKLKTGQTKLLVKNGNRFAINHNGTLSLTTCNSGPVQLNTAENQKMIKRYPVDVADESYIYGPGFVNNDGHIMLSERHMSGSFINTCLKRYSTHLAVTKNKTVEQLLALCLSARQKKERKSWYRHIMDFIGNLDG